MSGTQPTLQSKRRLKSGLVTALILASTVIGVGGASAAEPWPGATSDFHGFTQYDFKVEELACKVVVPKKVAEGKPWIWRARFFGHEPGPEIELLSKGFHVAYVDVADLFGSPKAVGRWDRFYKYLTEQHGLAKKPALEGMSRGGLIIFNWAIRNPDKVSCIYADAPVCDIKSWPGPYKTYKRRVRDWNNCLKAYGMTKEEAMVYKGNPVDNLQPLAKAKIPLFHVVGAADRTVPVADNTAVIEKRYKALGGEITVISKPNVGHRHGLPDPKPIVDFVLKNTLPKADFSQSR